MSRTVDAVFADAMQLPVDERERVALQLLDSIGKAPPDEALDDAWSDEVARRLAEWRTGQVCARPWDEVRAELQQKLRRP